MTSHEQGLLREIAEHARKQALIAWWRRWYKRLIAMVVVVAVAVVVSVGWIRYRQQQVVSANNTLVQLLVPTLAGESDQSEPTQAFFDKAQQLAALAQQAPAETATLAYFAAARAALAAGEPAIAAEYYQQAAQVATVPYLADLALVYQASLDPDRNQAVSRLLDLAQTGGIAASMAKLNAAILLGRNEQAKALLRELSSDAATDPTTASIAELLVNEQP